MSFTSALIISGIILVFIVFGAGLMWGEYQSRHDGRSENRREPSFNAADADHELKKAA